MPCSADRVQCCTILCGSITHSILSHPSPPHPTPPHPTPPSLHAQQCDSRRARWDLLASLLLPLPHLLLRLAPHSALQPALGHVTAAVGWGPLGALTASLPLLLLATGSGRVYLRHRGSLGALVMQTALLLLAAAGGPAAAGPGVRSHALACARALAVPLLCFPQRLQWLLWPLVWCAAFGVAPMLLAQAALPRVLLHIVSSLVLPAALATPLAYLWERADRWAGLVLGQAAGAIAMWTAASSRCSPCKGILALRVLVHHVACKVG